jgi:hypothetical protein
MKLDIEPLRSHFYPFKRSYKPQRDWVIRVLWSIPCGRRVSGSYSNLILPVQLEYHNPRYYSSFESISTQAGKSQSQHKMSTLLYNQGFPYLSSDLPSSNTLSLQISNGFVLEQNIIQTCQDTATLKQH